MKIHVHNFIIKAKKIITVLSFLILVSIPLFSQTVIKMKSEGGVSIIPCKVNGLNLNFIFDTGASDVSISLTEASFMLKNGYLDTADIMGTSKYLDANGNINEGVVINLKEIEIAGLKMFNVKASIIKNIKAPLLFGQSAISKLGLIQIDLKSNSITIPKGKGTYDYSKYIQSKNKATDSSANKIHKSENDYLEEIKLKISTDDFEGIISDCYRIIDMNPRSYDAYYRRAYAKTGLGDFASAIDDYSKAIEINPYLAKAYCFRGDLKAELNNHKDALIDFNKSIAIDQKNGFAYLSRGRTKVALKNYRQGIADYIKAIQLDANEPENYSNRGYAKGQLKDHLGELADYNKAIELGANNYVIYLNRASTKVQLKNYNSAIADYNKSLEINSKHADTYYGRGVAKENLKDYEGAINDYDKTLELDSTFYMASVMKVNAEQNLKENIWIKISSNNGRQWFLKSTIESKDGAIIKIWIKEELKNQTIKKNGKATNYNNVKELMIGEFDCKNKMTKFSSAIYYDSKGNVLQHLIEETKWENIIPESIGEKLFSEVCERFN